MLLHTVNFGHAFIVFLYNNLEKNTSQKFFFLNNIENEILDGLPQFKKK